MRDLITDMIGAVCLFVIPFGGLFIGYIMGV